MSRDNSSDNTDDQRFYERSAISELYEVIHAHTEESLGVLKDLSIDGMCLVTDERFSPGDRYEVRIVTEHDSLRPIEIAVGTECRWLRDLERPGFFEAGFLIDAYHDSAYRDLTAALEAVDESRRRTANPDQI